MLAFCVRVQICCVIRDALASLAINLSNIDRAGCFLIIVLWLSVLCVYQLPRISNALLHVA